MEQIKLNKEPKGIDLLATLINLLAEQEGVKITYELTEERQGDNGCNNDGTC